MHSSIGSPTCGHLGVEATRLLREKRGIARYVRNVVRELAMQYPALRFTFFVDTAADVASMRSLLAEVHPELPGRAAIEPIAQLATTSADVVWYAWNFITTRAPASSMVVTIHDLAPMLQLDHRWWKLFKRVKYKRRYLRTIAHADAIVTDSAFSRRELAHHLGVDPFRVTITALAADDLPLHGADDAAPLDAAGVGGPFFLFVGAQDARKNLTTLYAAMERLWAGGDRTPLVLCGPTLSRETRAQLGTAPWLRHLGYVSDAQLATLYRRATALVFPSRYEGFGLPVAEAMRAGTPVICASGSSLAEVAGSSALLVPWNDVDGFAREMQRLLVHPALREELRRRSLTQATKYSWARTARETFAVFERAARQRRERHAAAPAPSPREVRRSAALAAGTPVAAASALHDFPNR